MECIEIDQRGKPRCATEPNVLHVLGGLGFTVSKEIRIKSMKMISSSYKTMSHLKVIVYIMMVLI